MSGRFEEVPPVRPASHFLFATYGRFSAHWQLAKLSCSTATAIILYMISAFISLLEGH